MPKAELPATEQPTDQAPKRVPRFTIGTMMLITFIFAVMASGAGYLLRGLEFDESLIIVFFSFILIAPMGIAIGLSLFRFVITWLAARK